MDCKTKNVLIGVGSALLGGVVGLSLYFGVIKPSEDKTRYVGFIGVGISEAFKIDKSSRAQYDTLLFPNPNGNELVTLDQIIKSGVTKQIGLSYEAAAKIFNRIDIDGDGKISKDEFWGLA